MRLELGDALCAEDPERFFPPGNSWGEGVNLRHQIDEAKAMCARCPLIDACTEWSLTVDDKFAIIAGLTPYERDRVKRAAKRKSRAKEAS